MISKTAWIMIVTALIWLVWDVYLYATNQTTISEIIVNFSLYSPVLPFAVGILCGHWFWPIYVERKD